MADADSLEALAHPEYWDARYSNPSSVPTYEWFKSFDSLKPFFAKHLPPPISNDGSKSPRILHLGCGNSVNSPSPPFFVPELFLSILFLFAGKSFFFQFFNEFFD